MPDILKLLLLIVGLIPLNFIGAFICWQFMKDQTYKDVYSGNTTFNITIGGLLFAMVMAIYEIFIV